ncbi:MAG: hypothetical protein ACO4AJ_14105 [Prochlorothrix sp.]
MQSLLNTPDRNTPDPNTPDLNTPALYTRASLRGCLSYQDLQDIQRALASPSTQGEERRCIQRLLHSVRSGHIRLVG